MHIILTDDLDAIIRKYIDRYVYLVIIPYLVMVILGISKINHKHY